MIQWTDQLCRQHVARYDQLTQSQKSYFIDLMNRQFPFHVYQTHRDYRHQAFENEKKDKTLLQGATQFYPKVIYPEKHTMNNDLAGCAIVLTAGGEGERLRLSLLARGYPKEKLEGFTKATFALPDFFHDFGTLQTNLILIQSIAKRLQTDIPVIVTTGPEGSETSRVIQQLMQTHGNFGLNHVLVIPQHIRLHLTLDDQIAWQLVNGMPQPVTHPDETGGPIMRLKEPFSSIRATPLQWLQERKVDTLVVLQATAIYHPDIIFALTGPRHRFDFIGSGIIRKRFVPDDPYGTYVGIEKEGKTTVRIIEQNVRNEQTRRMKNPDGTHYLPYNTGLYAFGKELLQRGSLPHYATPPKEILPDMEKSPKVGYAATDLIRLAENPAILAVPPDWFAAIKNADDLATLSKMARAYGLDKLCQQEGF